MVGARRLLAHKNPAKTDIFAPIATFQRTAGAATPDIDENRSLPYKPRQLSAMARFFGGRLIGAANGPLWPASITGRLLNSTADCLKRRIAMSAEIDP